VGSKDIFGRFLNRQDAPYMLQKNVIDKIGSIVGDRNLRLDLDRVYAFPEDASLIPRLVKSATQNSFKVIPVGNESHIQYNKALSGFPLKIEFQGNELILSLSKMNRVKKVIPEDLYVILEPGVALKDLNKLLEPYNLFYPLATKDQRGTVGGSVGCGLKGEISSSGRKERIVHTKDFVLALDVVTADGELIKTGARVFKSVTGYDLPRIFTGSWGTLGIITEISLRLHPIGRKKDFDNLVISPFEKVEIKSSKDDPKTNLNLRIKGLLDPKGVFADLNV